MYTGFEFDYRNAKPNSDLDCVMQLSRPAKQVDIYRKAEKKATVFHGQIHLANESGHFAKVGYVNKELGDTGTTTVETICSYQGSKVFTMNYSIDFD